MLKMTGLFAGLLAVILAGSLTGCKNDKGNGMNKTTVDVNQMDPGGNYHMIFRRILERDYASVEAFLKAGVDVNIRGFLDETPAMKAATQGDWKMVELLINYGADLSIADRRGNAVADVARGNVELKNVALDTPGGEAFLRVLEILKERGLY